ncbi:MAG TPA: EamA family transporter [Terriglobales bacterium]|nr:EamA family transporter [Terriglobales bacterium]
MNLRKLATLAGVALFASCGDVALARGMKAFGAISLAHWTSIFSALLSPWVILGICLLLAFFVSYLSALSFADLTYVLPATSLGYIVMALLAKFFLHENISILRWTGILLIALGVGFVARGPALTLDHERSADLAGNVHHAPARGES